MRLSELDQSSDDEIDLDFDYWASDRLTDLCNGLQSKWGDHQLELSDQEWGELAAACDLPTEVAQSLKVAVVEEFSRDIFRLDGPLMIGTGNSAESRLVCRYHGIKYILQLFSTCIDELWSEDGVDYKTVVVSPHNDLDRDLAGCIQFIRQAMDELQEGSVLVCCNDGNSRSAAVILAYWLQYSDPDHSLQAAIEWYNQRRQGLTLDEGLTHLLEKYEMMAQVQDSPGKRKLMVGSPASPGKKIREQVCANISEFKL